MNLFLVVVTVLLIETTKCAKILGVFPLAGKSHYILGSSLMRGLAEKGHDVTVINPFGEKKPPKNGTYRDILISSGFPDQGDGPDKGDGPNLDLFDLDKMSFVNYAVFMHFFGKMYTEEVLNNTNVQKLLQSGEKFDVVIVEQFVNDALKAIAYHFKAPLVVFVTFGSNSWINPLVSNPAPPSYIPEQQMLLDPKNFCHRLKNTIINTFGLLFRNLVDFPSQDKLVKKYFPNALDLDDILYNASLVLLNSHVSTNMAVPRVPAMIDIGGFHVQPPQKLPKDLQDYLDNAKEGVIYFSMGSALQSVNLPPKNRDALLRVFSKLKQKVLWKWEADVLPGQPPNVKLGKWLPQQDILAHPNIKLFITHGGLLSFIESVYHGVPILAIPVYGDQKINAAEAAWNGCGRFILYDELDETKLAENINELLNNPTYRENMKKRSKIMHDRRSHPIDDADYWIRYVIRHQGAAHLRVAGLQLPWYQYLSLDVAAFISGVTLLVLYLFYVFVKIIVNKLKGPTEKSKLKKN